MAFRGRAAKWRGGARETGPLCVKPDRPLVPLPTTDPAYGRASLALGSARQFQSWISDLLHNPATRNRGSKCAAIRATLSAGGGREARADFGKPDELTPGL